MHKEKHTLMHSCKHDASGYFFICVWLMLTRIIFEDADFEIVEVDGFYKMVFAESGFAASLKLADVRIQPDWLREVKLPADSLYSVYYLGCPAAVTVI